MLSIDHLLSVRSDSGRAEVSIVMDIIFFLLLATNPWQIRGGDHFFGKYSILSKMVKKQPGVLAYTPQRKVRGLWRIRLTPLLIIDPIYGMKSLILDNISIYGYVFERSLS